MCSFQEFPRTSMYVPEENLTYYSWLEKVEYLKPSSFDTLSHFTTFPNADDILATNLKSHRINDHSIVTKGTNAQVHPLYHRKVLWVSPDNRETTETGKCGNVRFYTSDLEFLKNLNFYLVEFVDNCMLPVVRVLATPNTYSELLQFDILKRNGPLFLTEEGIFCKFTSFKRSTWSYYEEVDVEIMMESCEAFFTYISYVKCLNPSSIVKNERYIEKLKSFQCEFGELHYAMFHFKHRHNNLFTISELQSSTQDSIQAIASTDVTYQWYPLHVGPHCENNNPNKLIQLLNFDRALYNHEIQREDLCVVEDLHHIYETTGEIPDAHVMAMKLLEGKEKMRYYRSFREVFELFLDHFKSKDAQVEVQNSLMKFLFFH